MAERTNAPSARNVYIYRQDHHQRLVVGLQWLGREAAGFVTRGSKSIPAMSQRLESRGWTFNLTSSEQYPGSSRWVTTADDRIVLTGYRSSWPKRARWIRLTPLCWVEPSEVQQGIGESELSNRFRSTSETDNAMLLKQVTSIT